MKNSPPNPQDLAIWNGLFTDVPEEWRAAPPSAAMLACAVWLRHVGARSVLDLGCGVGRWTVWLQRQGFETVGTDFAPKGVAYAQAWAAEEGLDIPFLCVPVTERAFPERRFDAIVAALVLDLISPAELAVTLEVVHASLHPGGHLFALFNPADPPGEQEGEGNPTAGVTRVSYSDEELGERLATAGFTLQRRENFEVETRGFLWKLAAELHD